MMGQIAQNAAMRATFASTEMRLIRIVEASAEHDSFVLRLIGVLRAAGASHAVFAQSVIYYS